jgi:catechol 2,3-dioxygenase-like lactoylglutathione lyase family enzyme
MDPRVSYITLAVDDLDAAREFYVDGLGWPTEMDLPGEVIMIKVGDRLILSLWAASGFESEVGPIRRGDGLVPVTLAHNVGSPREVDEVLETAHVAGAGDMSSGEYRDWGGYTGYFADPNGFRWEVAWNPGPTGDIVLPESRSAEPE